MKGFCWRDICRTLFLRYHCIVVALPIATPFNILAIIDRKDIDIEILLFVAEIVQISEFGATSRFSSDQEANETDLRFRCLENKRVCDWDNCRQAQTISGYTQYDISFAKKNLVYLSGSFCVIQSPQKYLLLFLHYYLSCIFCCY